MTTQAAAFAVIGIFMAVTVWQCVADFLADFLDEARNVAASRDRSGR